MVYDKTFRANYKKALSLKTKEECDLFMNSLSIKERGELIAFCEDGVIYERRKTGTPINEYFLLHIDEYKTEEEKEASKSAQYTLALITIIAVIIGIINALAHVW